MSQFGFNPVREFARLRGTPSSSGPEGLRPVGGGAPRAQVSQRTGPAAPARTPFGFGRDVMAAPVAQGFAGQPDVLRQIAEMSRNAGQATPMPPRNQGAQQPIGGGALPLGGGFQATMPGAVPGTPGTGGSGMGFTQAGQRGGNGLVQTPQGPMTAAEAQRRGLTGPFSTQNLMAAFQQDVQGQQGAYDRQRERQMGAEQGFRQTLEGVPQEMERGLREATDPLNAFARQLESMGQGQYDQLMGLSRQMGGVGAPDMSLVRRDLDASNQAAGAAVGSAVQARAQYGDRSTQRASAIATSLQTQVRDAMTQLEGGLQSGMLTPQQYQQERLRLEDSVRQQTTQGLAQYLDESERYRAALTQNISAAQQQQAGQLGQNAQTWASAQIAANQQQREGLRDAAQVASYAVQAQQRMIEAAGQVRQYVSSVVNASVLNTANLMLQGWQNYSQMIDAHPEGYASITNGLLALAQVDAARSTPQRFTMLGRDPADVRGLGGSWQVPNSGLRPGGQGTTGRMPDGPARRPRTSPDLPLEPEPMGYNEGWRSPTTYDPESDAARMRNAQMDRGWPGMVGRGTGS